MKGLETQLALADEEGTSSGEKQATKTMQDLSTY